MRVGRNIYALGGNKNSAFYSGIDVKFHMLLVFIISGVCAGLAGVVSTARLGAAEPLAGMGFETYAIASAIIGGTSVAQLQQIVEAYQTPLSAELLAEVDAIGDRYLHPSA